MEENEKQEMHEESIGASWISKNTLVPISLVIVLITLAGYMERRLTTLESMYEKQSIRIEHLEARKIPPNEVLIRLNRIEKTLDRLENTIHERK